MDQSVAHQRHLCRQHRGLSDALVQQPLQVDRASRVQQRFCQACGKILDALFLRLQLQREVWCAADLRRRGASREIRPDFLWRGESITPSFLEKLYVQPGLGELWLIGWIEQWCQLRFRQTDVASKTC